MKYVILSATALSLMLGGCTVPQNAGSEFYSGTGQNGVAVFPANLHGGQPYMTQPVNVQMRRCAVTATAFEPPAKDDPSRFAPPADDTPMKMIAASCWI